MSIFKDNIDVLLSIITHICNASLKKGIFPENLAVAIITCLYKAGDSQLLQNYRAISLLVAFSKILEKLVYGRLIGHFFQNNFFTPAQFAFLPGKSTLMQLRK